MKRKVSVNKLSIYRFRNADACELLSRKGGYSPLSPPTPDGPAPEGPGGRY
jgi:hypothetical protein